MVFALCRILDMNTWCLRSGWCKVFLFLRKGFRASASFWNAVIRRFASGRTILIKVLL